MNEEIKNNELTDEQLEKVTGGDILNVIDGEVINGSDDRLSGVEPENIGGMEILRDASSTAIYVSGGGNLA